MALRLGRKAKETVNVVEQLLGGVEAVRSWEWENKRKHLRCVIQLEHERFFIVMSMTASDARARLNQIGDVKRELRRRGVEL